MPRHSSPVLTLAIYTHFSSADEHAALDKAFGTRTRPPAPGQGRDVATGSHAGPRLAAG
ncbi:MAG: hypothetical protein VYC34_00830 [Planctomycetota bacterium]|nr:hypothetical protein [Planctomycetota bacterium]